MEQSGCNRPQPCANPEGVENSELPQVSERVVGPGDEFLLQSALGLALSASAAVRKR